MDNNGMPSAEEGWVQLTPENQRELFASQTATSRVWIRHFRVNFFAYRTDECWPFRVVSHGDVGPDAELLNWRGVLRSQCEHVTMFPFSDLVIAMRQMIAVKQDVAPPLEDQAEYRWKLADVPEKWSPYAQIFFMTTDAYVLK